MGDNEESFANWLVREETLLGDDCGVEMMGKLAERYTIPMYILGCLRTSRYDAAYNKLAR